MSRGVPFFIAGMALTLAGGWIAFPRAVQKRSAQPLQFSHRVHADKGGMKCEDCHSLLANGSFSGVPRVEKCSGCHATPSGSTPDEKLLVDQYVTANREIPWKMYGRQPDNAWFPHAYHVNLAKLTCEQCHGDHGKTDKLPLQQVNRISGYRGAVMKMSNCEQCHHDKGVSTGCIDCHK